MKTIHAGSQDSLIELALTITGAVALMLIPLLALFLDLIKI